MTSPIQKILFGSPGVGKSHRILSHYIPVLKVTSSNCVNTVFHPEYSYGDFMGKLLPLTKEGKVEYRYHPGAFLEALAKAYYSILETSESPQNVLLVIDEINRGNSSAIFGSVFQLLDRNVDGWSSYDISISEMEFEKMLNMLDIVIFKAGGTDIKKMTRKGIENYEKHISEKLRIHERKIRIPPNLSIIATMNISDNSIYYMDSAFKRRWDWEFIDVEWGADQEPTKSKIIEGKGKGSWVKFVNNLNSFIKQEYRSVRRIEDKQLGYWFVKSEVISLEDIKNKVLFFIWDSVFSSNKKPLVELLSTKDEELLTFGDFSKKATSFIDIILKM